MRVLRLYAAAIVLALWAALWALGVRSDELVGAALALLAVGAFISQRESIRLWRDWTR